jgi:RNA polymerase sigma-70 factor (ECF subfamily)
MDQELVVRAQQGDQRAFVTLTAADYPRLFRLAFGILRDHGMAEDATQQAYLDIWRNIRRLREPASFEGWSYRVLVHACYAEAKRRPRWIPETEIPVIHDPHAADEFAAVLDRDELERGFRHLTVDHRVVIVMHYLLDMTLPQVAEVLDIPLGTVSSRLDRAMKSMRAALGVAPDTAAIPQEAIR